MADDRVNPWKLTAIGMALVMATALATGLVVAGWKAPEAPSKPVIETAPGKSAAPEKPAPARSAPRVASQPGVPTQAAIDSCNRQAAAQVGTHDKTMEVVKDAALGAVVGAAVGAAGGAVADGGKGAGKGAAIGGLVGAGGGTLYGLNENRKHDEKYRVSYGACMRSRGYAG
jgi:hypothetical protein